VYIWGPTNGRDKAPSNATFMGRFFRVAGAEPPRGTGQGPVAGRSPVCCFGFYAAAIFGLRRLLMRMSGPRYDGLPYPSDLPALMISSCSRNSVRCR